MTENFKGIGSMSNVFKLIKEKFELQSNFNQIGNKIWRLKGERLSLSSHISTIEKKIVVILKKETGMKFVESKRGSEDG